MKANVFFVSFLVLFLQFSCLADIKVIDSAALSQKIANSLSDRFPKDIKSIAIWRLNDYVKEDYINARGLRDSLEIAIVKTYKLKLIDRTKLDLILQEQGLSQTGLIDPKQMKEIGKLYGIDALIFGDIIENKIDKFTNLSLVMKAIDTETGLLVYADEFPVDDRYLSTCVDDMNKNFWSIINKEQSHVKANKINTIAFWRIDDTGVKIDSVTIMDKLYKILVNDTDFKVVDRENLTELLKEQSFGVTGLVDPATAKKIGKLYGVDAFIFGKINNYNIDEVDGAYVGTINATLKMIDVNTAQIIWADELQGSFSKPKKDIYAFFGEEIKKPESWLVPVAKSAVIPGWGQRHNGQVKKGNIFFWGEVLTVGAGYYAHTQYKTAWENYMNATTRADMDKYYNEANTYYNIRNGCIYLAIGIWLYNIYDARVNHNPLRTSNIYILPKEDKILFGARLQL